MKDSGIEWIGDIPAEWRKTQLRHCAAIKSGITLGKKYEKTDSLVERPYLRVANVQDGYVDLSVLTTIEVTQDEDLKYRLRAGDVLMTEGGDRDKLGRGCVWHGEIEPCLHQNHIFAVQTSKEMCIRDRETYDDNGNPIWNCECHIAEEDYYFDGTSSSKKEAKKDSAFRMLLYVLGMEDE